MVTSGTGWNSQFVGTVWYILVRYGNVFVEVVIVNLLEQCGTY